MSINTDSKKIEQLLTRGVDHVIVKESLKKKLASGEKLRVKFGIDPTGYDLHIGHAVPLRKLKQFQDGGHQVILLIGDYTAMIGDPTGKNATRPMLKREDVEQNMKTYIEQASRILDMDNVEIRYNSEWYGQKGFDFALELTSKVTVARILERDDFQKRLKEGSDIQMQEIMYPLLQGYDSVMLDADIEIGGTDQKFNMLMGRKLQKRYEKLEQDVIMIPLLEGTDGVQKMSKTYNNYIGLLDTAEDVYGKTMSIPDEMILRYFELATDVSSEEIEGYKKRLDDGENPRNVKMILAEELTKLYHGDDGVEKGKAHFEKVIQSKGRPEEIAELQPASYEIIAVLVEAGAVNSNSDARRAIEQGGVKVNDEKVIDLKHILKSGDVVQKGKRFFVQLI
ncbi:tyrosine--tRNA ligase [Patescibacteria group bacterium]|nr:tyrosine--tRNA ligase [Patescibacteria group bacterium]MBU1721694.1 tyrosine--tRNA ligase [Patescibacteria group bacterium]MBU1901749.1 tyrosine--tRNA ligase [Patescibacteria group bacterium]